MDSVTDNDKFGMGVKKAFRPEWLDSENALFVNKLNYCAKHFEPTHKLVSFCFFIETFQTQKLKTVVFDDHKIQLDDLEMKLRDIKEEHTYQLHRLENMETNLPKMIREMIDYYTEQKLQPKFDGLVNKEQLKE